MTSPPLPPLPPPLPNFWLGAWSRPPDCPAQVALALGGVLLIAALVPGGPRRLLATLEATGVADPARTRRFLSVASFIAAFLSLGYIAFYLRGGPRAPEAATYWLQGRALSHGNLAWTASSPMASFRARNLLLTLPDRLSGVLPPGYALLLSAAFLLGAPMLVGPLLAAALVPATWWLARELARPRAPGAVTPEDERRIEWTGRLAAAFSIVSAALRYHTAESLPHGAAALALAVALASALRARRTGDARTFVLSGLALGLLLATEPLAAAVAFAVVAALALETARARALLWAIAGALPGAALLLAANRAAVGHAFASPLAFYASRIAPAAAGGAKVVALTALERLRANLADVANFEPIALLPLLLLRPAARARLGAPVVWAAALVVVQTLVLGLAARGEVTPGGGASALANVLPVEHALVALALVVSLPEAWVAPAATGTLALALAGFAVHTAHYYERVAAEGIGRPRYEPDVAREAGANRGLLFFDDDEGYELAHDPGVIPSHGVEAVRSRGDDHDRLLYDLLGRPQSHRYVTTGRATSSVSIWTPTGSGDLWRFESEADFPPVATPDPGAGRATVVEGACASDGHAVEIRPAGAAPASATIELPVPHALDKKRSWTVMPRVFQEGTAGAGHLALVLEPGGAPLAEWTWTNEVHGSPCVDLPGKVVELGGEHPRAWLVVTATGGAVALDKTTLRGR